VGGSIVRRVLVSGLALASLVAASSLAAPPTIPASLPYQGLLLDGLGAPRTGSVDLTVRIWDAVVGGTLVYKQSFPGVALADGVFTVQLGPAGEGTDAPANPLTTDLATALAGDAGATAPVRFLEVTVGGDGALSCTQILSSAYAVRAASAAAADTATNATNATNAANATNVSGVSGQYVTEFFEQFNADGGGPPNFDPSEGIADADGDGILNFVDSDNDNDTIGDSGEISQGSNINLVTPIISGTSPTTGLYTASSLVTVNGANFQPPLQVTFGSQTPAASNVTPTSFQVTVGPQLPGTVGVTVMNANGEVRTGGSFTFTQTIPHSIVLNPGTNAIRSSIDVRNGTNFVVYSGQKQYGIGDAATGPLTIFGLTSRALSGQIATAFDATGRLHGLRCEGSGTNCLTQAIADANSNLNLEDDAPMTIETVTGSNALLQSAAIEFDSAGRRAVAYQKADGTTATTIVAYDRNGDGDFADATEYVAGSATLYSVIPTALAIDASGHIANVRGGGSVQVAWDRSGDGDFDDTVGGNPELFTVAGGTPTCIGAAFDAAGRLAVVYGSSQATLVRDLNADGDFADAGESSVLEASVGSQCDLDVRAGQPFTVVHSSGSGVTVRMDKNDDGDFADAGETSTVVANALGLRLRLNGGTTAFFGLQGAMGSAPTN
jgi:IPT/TIG domain